jgi:MYXO-CTERM domain-containing protein
MEDTANWPNDPGYAGQWNLWSFMPLENKSKVSAYELSIGSGMHADRAWQRTTGDRRVIIAVLDSGIRWQERDLVNKFYLNRGELPVPEAACGVAAGADAYDVNGDGVFNVQDYTTATGTQPPDAGTICDTRLTDVNANGILDPQDLILTFSDDTDGDANGWIDDISGWDMFDDDNDPSDDTDFGHGTGEARDSASETNNGRGDAGVCPECSLLMVRAGDSFVVDANDFAMGAIFAVDSGASVIQEALGSINATPLMYQAIEYAWQQNVVIIASAADEDSFHANFPGSTNHTVYVHAIRYNKTNREASDSFLAFNNCTNYGAQLLLSTPGTGCSSEATGKLSGMAGLLQSAALESGLPPPDGVYAATDALQVRRLSSEEMKQLMLTTVDDIYDPNDATDPTRYETFVGWEKRFGYGRTNARNAVDAILDWRIPPAVDVHEPEWFRVIYPDQTPSVDITGEIEYRTDLFDSYDYVVEWAPGIEPEGAEWTTLAEGTGETDFIEGTIATFDVSNVTIDNDTLPEPDYKVNRYMVTVRVRVILSSADGTRDGTQGEIRRAFHIVRDPDLVSGFPLKLGGSFESSPKFSDLDGDGKMELVAGEGSGLIHALDETGNEKQGWPVAVGPLPHLDADNPANHRGSAAFVAGPADPDARSTLSAQTPAIGDLDGDGPDGRSVVIGDFDGHVYVYDESGAVRSGWPQTLDRDNAAETSEDWTLDDGFVSSPILADIDNDGDLEIVLAAMDAHVYAWHHDGSAVAGWPVLLSAGDKRARIVETPAMGDVDGDGTVELVVGTNEDYDGTGRFYLVRGDGSIAPGFPKSIPTLGVLPFVGTGLPNSPAMANTDESQGVETVFAGIVALPRIVRGDGTAAGTVDNVAYGEHTTSDDIPSLSGLSSAAFGDVNNDGVPDVVSGGAGFGFAEAFAGSGERVDFDHHVGAWDGTTNKYLPGFPQRVDDTQFFQNPIVADVDGDGKPEVIVGSGGYYLHAWNEDGVEPEGWPKFTGGWIISSATVGDIDGDGTLEVATATRGGWLFAWHTTGRIDGRIDWASFHHDDHNTRNMDTPIGFGSPATPDTGGGCGCTTARRSTPSAALLALGIAALALIRRRGRS